LGGLANEQARKLKIKTMMKSLFFEFKTLSPSLAPPLKFLAAQSREGESGKLQIK